MYAQMPVMQPDIAFMLMARKVMFVRMLVKQKCNILLIREHPNKPNLNVNL